MWLCNFNRPARVCLEFKLAIQLAIATLFGSNRHNMATSQTQKLSREDFKRQKVIEEQRKAGTLPAEVDPETGRDINPHIPHYISQAPWYLDIDHPTLKHQRSQFEEGSKINEWYARGARAGPAATKYRKGACENCGAMSHKTKECVDRPRRMGAKWTGKNIQADEVVQKVELGFEAKRDRWNGWDPQQQIELAKEWELVEEERRKIRERQVKEKEKLMAAELAQATITVPTEAEAKKAEEIKKITDSDDSDDDEEKYADRADMVGQKLDTKSRTTVRNLRIREDTAKYLLNLDVDSAYYDPKTRSMRDNPLKDKDPSELQYAGDNFLRWTGDAPNVGNLQAFAWEAENRGNSVHLHANPTQAALLYKEYQSKKGAVSEKVKNSILDRYGGAEHLAVPPKELLLAQTEQYVEYSQSGRVIKGQEKAAVKSKYEEDALVLNHTAVWGSYWKEGRWGYGCCHSMTRSAYCTGQAGIDAANASTQLLTAAEPAPSSSSEPPKSLLEQYVARAAVEGAQERTQTLKPRAERLGEGKVKIDKNKLKDALAEERKRKAQAHHDDKDDERDMGKKAKYGSSKEIKEVTEEELEAYRLARSKGEDPMANYVDKDEI
ncbi:Pre-mRNA splicing Prp18-interacting factor-domain-containing protein [Phlyctochytrium arcticum]|nr:Pre-mRNA splicing Prp18-interacting factor-domain-containing protein [Phlyctochytrium arcticum]